MHVSNRGTQLILTVVLMIFGFMLALQLKARPAITANISYQRAAELTALLKAVEEERNSLREEVKQLRDRLAESAAGLSREQALREELSKARILAGLADVKGPGVIVQMTDSKKPSSAGQDPNVYLIHDDDVRAVVNELFSAGAEAVSINGQRFVATTEIRCAGPVFMINGVRIAPPIEIRAIGDPETLDSALHLRGGVIDNLALWGIEVKVKREEEVLVPAYNGTLQFKYAKPVKAEGTR
ncbi:MAG TPA: DUF881 domain-containing protein [Firmicutes bacterium]|nr:DUF881 domain-containing protein [Candidatus Fermentithermobacillaceae bacterium]